MRKNIQVLPAITIVLLFVTSLTGILSLNFSKSFEVANQYGDIVRIYGYGIYSHDSYFKAPILIGSDFCIFFILVPHFIYTYFQNIIVNTNVTRIKMLSVYGISLYYAASISLGITYNQLHLVYIALLSCSLFGMFKTIRTIKTNELNFIPTKGMKIFLVLSGIALIAAWMPDIIPTIFSGSSLMLIEVYTTEITYVLDMGIIGPLCLVCLYLINKKDNLGTVILAVLLKICIIVGIMMIPQTICQLLSGYLIPIPVFIGKSGSFIALGSFAFYFNKKLYSNISF